ncbi:MAG: asparaginase [Nitrospinota bacterium]
MSPDGASSRKRVTILATGGTIASKADSSGRVSPAVTGAELAASIPGLSAVADVEVEQFGNRLGLALSLSDFLDITRRVNDILDGDADAVVVAHGTSTLTESAYLMDLLLRHDKPAVYTGAMYTASQPDTDGPRNVLNSVRLAADPAAAGRGALLCFDREIHTARDATKVKSNRIHAFSSGERGMLGIVDDDAVVFYRSAPPSPRFRVDRLNERVDLLKVWAGMDERLILAALDAGSEGLVLESLPGRGSVSPGTMKGVREALRRGIPVVVASGSTWGRTLPAYGGGSGSKDVAEVGAVLAGDLSAIKARILLMVALSAGTPKEKLPELFS